MAIAAVRNQLKTVNVSKIKGTLDKRHGISNQSVNFLISNQEKGILDADIKGFFNNINHE